jgi:hypothetical protein
MPNQPNTEPSGAYSPCDHCGTIGCKFPLQSYKNCYKWKQWFHKHWQNIRAFKDSALKQRKEANTYRYYAPYQTPHR